MTTQTLQQPLVSWEQDYQDRINPELMTRLLRASIPVLEESDWRVTVVEDGYCEAVLPLNKATTNQHGTHQAALISLSADYTGGLALATLLRGVPLAGIHRCRDDQSASLWLAGMNVKYKNPSSGHLTCVCEINPDQAADIRSRYFSGRRVLATLEVNFYSNGDLAAVAEMKYFAQPTSQLLPSQSNPSRSTLFCHKLKASARMIAGLRALTSDHQKITVTCPEASTMAGPHGALLAARLQSVLPQLKDMVLARTQHIDGTIRGVADLKQVVTLGVGLDMRCLRHAAEQPNVTFFEIDLPEMIAERKRAAAMLPSDLSDRRTLLEADFRFDDLEQVIGGHPEFDRNAATVFLYEGCSMYFTEAENQRILLSLLDLMRHPASCLWTDVVSTAVVSGRTNNRNITDFLEGMDSLGERFVFGVDDPRVWLASIGFRDCTSIRCDEYLDVQDAVFSTYSFCVARRT
ncbi:MAG: SAM-dependent methyltransferase [Planctomycetaceae bacterium]